MKRLLIDIIRIVGYGLIYTVIFFTLMYILGKISFYTYALIDQYVLILYIVGIILMVIRDVVYKKSIGIFLAPIGVYVIIVSTGFTPSDLPQYTYVGSCTNGDLYLQYLGPLTGRSDLVYFPGGRDVSVQFDRNTYEIEPYPEFPLSKFDEGCILKDPYSVTL